MNFVVVVAILGLLAVTVSADALSRAAEIYFNAGSRANPLLRTANRAHRLKRQTFERFNETDLFDLSASSCILKCLYDMDDKMEALFPTNTSDSSKKSKGEELMDDFDPAKFDQFCDIYRPSSKCLKQCPAGNLKNSTLNGLKMLETMCVTKNTEFKKNLPCMSKIGKEVEKVCAPKCEAYEHAIDKLEKFEDHSGEMDPDELKFLFSQGCKYVKCSEDCGHPMTEKACGKEAGDLETLLVQSAFQSVNDLMSIFDGLNTPELDFWPPECRQLGKESSNS